MRLWPSAASTRTLTTLLTLEPSVFNIWDADSSEQLARNVSRREAAEVLAEHGVRRADTAESWLDRADNGSEIALQVGGFTIWATHQAPDQGLWVHAPRFYLCAGEDGRLRPPPAAGAAASEASRPCLVKKVRTRHAT
jgi:hypothetical protein